MQLLYHMSRYAVRLALQLAAVNSISTMQFTPHHTHIPVTSTGLDPLVSVGAGTNNDSRPNVSVPVLTLGQLQSHLQ